MTDDPAERTPSMTPDIVPTPTPHGADAATGRGPGLATQVGRASGRERVCLYV